MLHVTHIQNCCLAKDCVTGQKFVGALVYEKVLQLSTLLSVSLLVSG